PSDFSFNDTSHTDIHTLSLHALFRSLFSEPDAGSDLANLSTKAYLDGDNFVINGEKIWTSYADFAEYGFLVARSVPGSKRRQGIDRKSTRLNSSHLGISYAVFCLKKN